MRDDMCRWLSLEEEAKRYRVEDALKLLEYEYVGAVEFPELERARSALGELDRGTFMRARAACNPCERLKKGGFVCRSALKLANLNAISGFKLKGKFLDLCSAPGGFGEYLESNDCSGFAMSLRGCNDDGRGLEVLFGRQIWGPKGNGDLYDRDNCRAAVDASKPVDLCVCDGGFEANRNQLDQDAKLERLALCEAATAWEALRDGGHLVIKLFLPLKCSGTLSLVALAALHFSKIGLVKPVTSRAASGELYLLALDFRSAIDDAEKRNVVEAFRRRADRLAIGGASSPVSKDAQLALHETLQRIVLDEFLASARADFVQAQTVACREILRYAAMREEEQRRTLRRREAEDDDDIDAYFDAWRIPKRKRRRISSSSQKSTLQ